MQLQMTHVTQRYPSPRGAVTALADASLTAAGGEFVALVGPSGCGKSTLRDWRPISQRTRRAVRGCYNWVHSKVNWGGVVSGGDHAILYYRRPG